MGDSVRYTDWYEKAQHDLNGAKILFEHDGGYDLVAFHCQQAIEKQLKGWLLKTTGELFDGHSLVFLCRKAIQSGADLKQNLRDCAFVNQFYIETRYPSDSYLPVSEDEAKGCLDSAELILNTLK
jgi:HEPN domain-containing protein